MPDILLHPQTAAQLRQVARQLPHAVLLSGAPGIGKATVAERLTADILGLTASKLAAYPYLRRLVPLDGKAISIETIRELEHFLALKIPGAQAIARIVIIEDAQTLTVEAQNGLLKTLEEPPARTLLLLTSAHDQALLPTIRSRVQTVTIKRPASQDLRSYLGAQGHAAPDIERALSLSGGLPGLAVALLVGDQNHPLVMATQTARDILQKSTYERLLLVDELAKQRESSLDVLFILEQMAHSALTKGSQPASKRWQNILTVAYEAHGQLLNSAQPKLVLTNLMLNL